MLEGNRCRLCTEVVRGIRARHKQVRYCERCALIQKRRNTLDPWTPEERREYMKRYMREYRRKHPGISTPFVQKFRNRKTDKTKVAAYALLRRLRQGGTTMDGMHELLNKMSDIELLILRATGLIILTCACGYIVWLHVKPLLEAVKGQTDRMPVTAEKDTHQHGTIEKGSKSSSR
jgi:hypothetical protein